MLFSVELLFNAGMPPTHTVGEPGDQGEAVAGLWHKPKGAMLIIGT